MMADNWFEAARASNHFRPPEPSNREQPFVWIFGYGSLCWFPGFEYSKCITGYIRGYVRRFYQGNSTHRGTLEKPGRVATLVENKEGITWGCAFKVTGSLALEYLKQRECTLGGYATEYIKFYPRVATENSAITGEAFPALIYIATPDNDNWIGEESIEITAKEISECRGPTGHNVEYLIRLAMFMRDEWPGIRDDYLFDLENLVRENLLRKSICLSTLMGQVPERVRRDTHEEVRRPISFAYTSRVPDKKLRCLNI